MAFTYDLSTTIGKVRFRIQDKDETDATKQLFQDSEIQAAIDAAGGGDELDLAAGILCDAVAASASLLAKAETMGAYKFDGKGIAENWRKAAARYRALAAGEDVAEVLVVELNQSDFAERDIVINEILRSSG